MDRIGASTAYLKSCGVPDCPENYSLPLHVTSPEVDVELESKLQDTTTERDNLFQLNQRIEVEKEDLRLRNQTLSTDLAAARER